MYKKREGVDKTGEVGEVRREDEISEGCLSLWLKRRRCRKMAEGEDEK